MIVTDWLGATWGADGTDIEVLSAPGLEDRALSGANLSGGIDGAVAAPKFAQIGAFVIQLLVLADSDEDMAEKLESIYAVTWGTQDKTAENPLTFTLPGHAPLTVYAAVTNRQVPTSFEDNLRARACTIPIAFEASDPMVYGAAVTTELTDGTVVPIVGGWAPSERWKWIAHGPDTDPTLTLSTDGHADQILRLNHAVSSGQNVLVDVTPHSQKNTVGGIDHLDWFDGGDDGILPQFFKLLPGQTLRFNGADGSFTYRPAKP